MITVPQMLGFPHGTPIDRTQVKVAAVYDRKQINGKLGPTTVQAAMLTDVGGNRIRLEAWGHGDLLMYKDKEVILEGKNGKGLGIKHGSYVNKTGVTVNTIELSMSKAGTIHEVAVFQANNPNVPVQTPVQGQSPAKAAVGGSPMPSGAVHGAKVGMALNNAVQIMVAQGIEYNKKNLWGLAQEIIDVSNDLEQGKAPDFKPAQVEQKPATPASPPTQEVPDEDVPF